MPLHNNQDQTLQYTINSSSVNMCVTLFTFHIFWSELKEAPHQFYCEDSARVCCKCHMLLLPLLEKDGTQQLLQLFISTTQNSAVLCFAAFVRKGWHTATTTIIYKYSNG